MYYLILHTVPIKHRCTGHIDPRGSAITQESSALEQPFKVLISNLLQSLLELGARYA